MGLSTLLSTGTMAAPQPSTTAMETPPATSPFLLAQANEGDENSLTLLRFETQHYLVRVYRKAGLTYLNVYNKETGFTDQNGVLAYLIEPEDEDDPWRVYANQQGDLEYRAMVNSEGDTALEIRLPDGPPAQPEYGYDEVYSFPHIFLGEGLAATLSTLEESGWSVESTSSERVELTRNQLALALKFDPETQVITYTQLSDKI
ncbi:MAG: hypothetical protein AAF892_04620 [Cyanobacteria bacterium P01_D01_bin.71]